MKFKLTDIPALYQRALNFARRARAFLRDDIWHLQARQVRRHWWAVRVKFGNVREFEFHAKKVWKALGGRQGRRVAASMNASTVKPSTMRVSPRVIS